MVNYGVGQQFDFNADVFFYVVLPPIIFHQVQTALHLDLIEGKRLKEKHEAPWNHPQCRSGT